MASTYTRPNSPFIWIRFKEGSKWKGKPTGYLKNNFGDERQARLLAHKQSLKEHEESPQRIGGAWGDWVERWISDRYRHSATATIYRRYWRRLERWLIANRLLVPSQILYRHAQEYHRWRTGQGTGNNTAIHELKFLGVVIGEAVKRGYCTGNPLVRMGMRRTRPKEKAAWTNKEIQHVARSIHFAPQWMQATFWLGLYQSARLRQCAVPIADIDFRRLRIIYRKTKGDKPFTQPLDKRIVVPLEAIVRARTAEGHQLLCDIPALPSVEWREFLDVIGLHHLSHHGLRVSWITRAALSGKVTMAEAKRFCNHASTTVHEAYQKLSITDVAHVPSGIDFPEL